jgi:AraC-like DNA-binding protein
MRYARGVLIDPVTFRKLVRARAMLEAEAEDALTVRDVAERVGMSPFQLIRQFAALFGTTPHQFRTRVRIERAKRLLEEGEPVTGVCMEVGFSSLGSFSALFTRWVGASPTSYRRTASVPASLPGCLELLAIPEKQPAA